METGYKFIIYEEQNATAFISLNRPDMYNALNAEAKLEVVQAIRDANKNSAIRSIVITGKGKAFCTGQDLNDRSVQSSLGPVDLGQTLQNEWNPLINSIRDSKKIIIAAVNGVCAGAGISVAIACDLIIAKPLTKFVGAFSRLGLAPDAGSTYTFVRALGYQKTMAFFLMSEPLMAEEMLTAGLINELDENPLIRSIEYSTAINKLSPISTEAIKKNLKFAMDANFNESMEREMYAQRFLGRSSDYKEGLSAFLEKREPQFTGN